MNPAFCASDAFEEPPCCPEQRQAGQDLLAGIGSGHTPILGLDVWERAYCLKHQTRPPAYVAAFYKVMDRAEVARRDAAARA